MNDWWRRAACRGHDPEMWTVGNRGNHEAIRICRWCPVREQCGEQTRDLGAGGTICAGRSWQLTSRHRRAKVVER